mmetsp:Transcript_47664/g.94066  ORF Transcript_47664/g.94066 Transcript_47664/m.94066 type:complete len:122 (+) Transcript_47664:2775-3140(+)
MRWQRAQGKGKAKKGNRCTEYEESEGGKIDRLVSGSFIPIGAVNISTLPDVLSSSHSLSLLLFISSFPHPSESSSKRVGHAWFLFFFRGSDGGLKRTGQLSGRRCVYAVRRRCDAYRQCSV